MPSLVPPPSPSRNLLAAAFASATLLLSACGGGGGGGGFGIGTFPPAPPPPEDTGRGSVVTNPPERVLSLSAGDFRTLLQLDDKGKALLQVSGTPKCGIDTRYLEYRTVGSRPRLAVNQQLHLVHFFSSRFFSGQSPVCRFSDRHSGLAVCKSILLSVYRFAGPV